MDVAVLACAASGFTNTGCRSAMSVTRRPRCSLPCMPGAKSMDAGKSSQPAGLWAHPLHPVPSFKTHTPGAPDGLRIIWSSPGYSHCCFKAHSDMDPVLVQKITQAFVAIDARDPASKVVLEGEACKAFVPGITTGWETLEKAAEQANIL